MSSNSEVSFPNQTTSTSGASKQAAARPGGWGSGMGEGPNKMKLAEAETRSGSSEYDDLVTGKTDNEDPVDIGEEEPLRVFAGEVPITGLFVSGTEEDAKHFHTELTDFDVTMSYDPKPLQVLGSEGPDVKLHTQESCEDDTLKSGLPRDNVLIQDVMIDRILGEGSFGLAVTRREKMETCVKEIQITDASVLEEVAILNSHDNIICQGYGALYYKDKDKDFSVFRIFMEFMPGGTMEELMEKYRKRNKSFETKEMRNWITQVMNGVAFLHQNRIVHFDIKADNILLDLDLKKARVRLGDFGNSSKRCDECDTCNESAACNQNLNCECSTWHDGRIDDIRETVKLTFQLVFIPEESSYIYMRMESASISSAIEARDSKLGKFVEACLKLSSSKDLHTILKSNEKMVQRRQ